MKKIYLLLLPVLFLWGSCSMDDVLESNGELNLTVIETNNPIKALSLIHIFAKQTLPGYCFYLNAQVRAWLKPVFPGIVK